MQHIHTHTHMRNRATDIDLCQFGAVEQHWQWDFTMQWDKEDYGVISVHSHDSRPTAWNMCKIQYTKYLAMKKEISHTQSNNCGTEQQVTRQTWCEIKQLSNIF